MTEETASTLEKIKGIIREVKPVKSEITEKTDIRDLEMDSLDIMNYMFSIEDNFGVKIADEELEEKDLYIVENVIRFINDRSGN